MLQARVRAADALRHLGQTVNGRGHVDVVERSPLLLEQHQQLVGVGAGDDAFV